MGTTTLLDNVCVIAINLKNVKGDKQDENWLNSLV